MKFAVGSDHTGYGLKEMLKSRLRRMNLEVVDCGTFNSQSCDYPDYAVPVALAVARHEANQGILICASGIGMSITANKIPGIRAALCLDATAARLSRSIYDANVLCLPSMLVGESFVVRILEVWLQTDFITQKYKSVVQKISQWEECQAKSKNSTKAVDRSALKAV